jgi:hypothetical protein
MENLARSDCGDGDLTCTVTPLLWIYTLSGDWVRWYLGPEVNRAAHPELGRQGLQAYVWRKLREKLPTLREPE